MLRNLMRVGLFVVTLATSAPSLAAPVSLELYLAADVSGSIDNVDFALQRLGFQNAFLSVGVQAAIVTSGGIAVKLVDFANNVVTAIDWTQITDAASATAFANAVIAAPRGIAGINDGQSHLINTALADLNSNDFEGTRRVLDIASEGAQDIDGCTFANVNCPTVQNARDAFLAGGGTTINAIWLNDRDFFGLDPTDLINAFEYGALNVLGGPGTFQVFAEDFIAFQDAIERKIIREVTGGNEVPEPATIGLLGLGIAALGLWRYRGRGRSV